ncbi:hypothetical protein GQ53DRAFT_756650 [Thozetella sp. PMI_491]|nr:hypothetical protein GQ53DRAFT_756650 [Thozetella sp. PMI_491]
MPPPPLGSRSSADLFPSLLGDNPLEALSGLLGLFDLLVRPRHPRSQKRLLWDRHPGWANAIEEGLGLSPPFFFGAGVASVLLWAMWTTRRGLETDPKSLKPTPPRLVLRLEKALVP